VVINEIDYETTEPNENFQDTIISLKSVVRKISKIVPSLIYTKCPISIPTYPMDLSCRKTSL